MRSRPVGWTVTGAAGMVGPTQPKAEDPTMTPRTARAAARTLQSPVVSRRGFMLLGGGLALGAAALALAPGAARAAVFTENGLAVKGYDPVAYFTAGKPVRGSEGFSVQHEGATYRFASQANLDAFRADPQRYLPQYGGYCAWAVAQGYKAPIIPEAWAVVDGKLYLNASRGVQRRWQRDIPGFIAQANQNWPNLR